MVLERYRLIFCFDCAEPVLINPDLNWRLRIYKAYKQLVWRNALDKSQFYFTHQVGYNGNDFERNHISLVVSATKKP